MGTKVHGTIKSKQEIERLFQTGRRSSSSFLTVLCSKADVANQSGRCAFIAGKKLGSAPFRNRCKRVMRAAAMQLGAPWNGYDVVFVARRKVAFGNTQTLVETMGSQLEDLGVLQG